MAVRSPIRFAALAVVVSLACVTAVGVRAQSDAPSIFATNQRVVNIGNVGMKFDTRGYIGEMFGSGTSVAPSFEYPLNSGVEHLWMAGLWVGAVDALSREPYVSSAVVDGTLSAGSTAPSGFEFAPPTRVSTGPDGEPSVSEDPNAALLISRNPLQQNFRLDALADQHFIVEYSDLNAAGADLGPDIFNPHEPLGVQVKCDILGFSSRFADTFVILLFEIENVGDRFLEDVYVGWYVEPLVVNRGKLEFPASGGDLFFGDVQGFVGPEPNAQEAAAEHFSSFALDADSEARLVYRFDGDGDRGDATSWAGVRFLGADPPEGFDINYRQWVYSSGGGIPGERDFGDAARYAYMKGCNSTAASYEDLVDRLNNEDCRTATVDAGSAISQGDTDFTAERNWAGLISVGPWPSLDRGEKVQFAVAMVAGATADELLANSAVAQFNYDNGFTVPPGPPSPRLRAIPRNNAVELRWDPGERPIEGEYDPVTASPEYHRSVLNNEFDFQGYRVYRLDAEAPESDPFEEARLIAEFDIAETVGGERDESGFNTGLPPLVGGERVFIDRNVLNGYPYLYAVTSYSTPNARTGAVEIESGFNENSVVVVPGSGPEGTGEIGGGLPEVSVYPNPYRGASIYDDRFEDTGEPRELDRKIYFANVPPRADIDVYNLAGTRIVQLQNRSVDDTLVEWNVMSERTRVIAPGLYIYVVEDLDTGEVQRGKLVILK